MAVWEETSNCCLIDQFYTLPWRPGKDYVIGWEGNYSNYSLNSSGENTAMNRVPTYVFFMWSTGPQNFEFCEIIKSIWKLCGLEVPERTKHVSFQIFNLKLWRPSWRHNVAGSKLINISASKIMCVTPRRAQAGAMCATHTVQEQFYMCLQSTYHSITHILSTMATTAYIERLKIWGKTP